MKSATALHVVSGNRDTFPSTGNRPAKSDTARCASICGTCNLRELCVPAGLNAGEMEQLNQIIHRKRPLKRGDHLYRTGDPLKSLYAIRTGFFKSSVLHEDGREQVAGFHMMGELLGMDAIDSAKHMCGVVAIEDSEVCEIPFDEFEELGRELPMLQQHFHRILSREIARDYGVMLLLGSMRAEERLAAFLLNLSKRFAARGYSSSQFHLRMTREEIGSHLGLKLETVSRAFSHFQNEGIVAVQNKNIQILDPERLHALMGQSAKH